MLPGQIGYATISVWSCWSNIINYFIPIKLNIFMYMYTTFPTFITHKCSYVISLTVLLNLIQQNDLTNYPITFGNISALQAISLQLNTFLLVCNPGTLLLQNSILYTPASALAQFILQSHISFLLTYDLPVKTKINFLCVNYIESLTTTSTMEHMINKHI